jgi:hypothetical protein
MAQNLVWSLSNTPFGLPMAQTFCIFQTRLLLDTFPIGHWTKE